MGVIDNRDLIRKRVSYVEFRTLAYKLRDFKCGKATMFEVLCLFYKIMDEKKAYRYAWISNKATESLALVVEEMKIELNGKC